MAANKYSDLLKGLGTGSSASSTGGRYDDLYLDLLSDEDRKRLQYRYQYQKPEGVGPPLPKEVSKIDLAGKGFSAEIEAAPSGIAAGTQLGTGAYLGESVGLVSTLGEEMRRIGEAPQGQAVDTTKFFDALNQIARSPSKFIAGTWTPEEVPGQLREAGMENLQETLAIRAKNAEEIQKLKQQYIEQGGSEFVADIATGLGSSATSYVPLAGAVFTGAVTKNAAATLAAQRILSILPATQAYASAYAEFKRENPDAPEEEAQKYAMGSAGIEFGVEGLIPAGVGGFAKTGLAQVGLEGVKRGLREGATEAVTEATQQEFQRQVAPELAPESVEESLYNIGLAAATGSLAGTAISTPGAYFEGRAGAKEQTTRAERVKAEAEAREAARLAELAAIDAKMAEGAAASQQLPAVSEAETAIAELQRVLPKVPDSVDLETPRGEASRLLDTSRVQEEPIGPSSPFVPRAPEVDLQTPRGETSTLLRAPDEMVRTPRGETTFLPEQPTSPEAPLTRQARITQRTQEAAQEPTATTPAPTPQAARSEAPRGPSVEATPLTRPERVALAELGYDGPEIRAFNPAQARTVLTNRVRKQDFDPATVDDEGNIVGEARPGQGAIAATDTEARRKLFEDAPEGVVEAAAEAQESALTNRSISPDKAAALGQYLNRTVPPDQRKTTPLRAALSRAKTAWDALAGVRAAVTRGADPGIERYDRLIQSLSTPDMKEVDFKVLQPETEATTESQRKVKEGEGVDMFTKGLHEIDKETGKQSITITGDGYAVRDGTATVETTLHEVVHAKTAKVFDDVRNGRETDQRVVSAVNKFDSLRGEVRKAKRESLTEPEKEAIDYATSDMDEFHTGVISNPLVQSALKKQKFWEPIVNTVRIMLGLPRRDRAMLEEVLDAAYEVVDAINAKTTKPIGRPGTQRSVSASPKPSSPINISRQTPITSRIGKFFSKLLQGPQPQVLLRANELQAGLIAQQEFVAIALTNRLRDSLGAIERTRGKDARNKLDAAALEYLKGKKIDTNAFPADFKEALDEFRRRWDENTNEIIRQIEEAFIGKDIPKEYQDLVKTLKSQKGKYVTRSYQHFSDKNYGANTWNQWTEGKKDPKKRDTPGYKRVSDFVSALGKTVENLPQKLETYRQEAASLGPDFEAWETATRSDLVDYYEALVGNPQGKSVKEMFDTLETKAKEIKQGSAENTAEIIAKVLLDPEKGDTPPGTQYRFYKNLATDDTALRKKSKINNLVRNLWGEVKGVEAVAAATSARQGAAIAGLKTLNDVFTRQPGLFSDTPTIEMTKQIPNNPQRFGALAGKYVHPVVHDGIVNFSTVNGDNPAIKAYGMLAGTQKSFNTTWNPRAYIQELVGGPVVMMANGVPPTLQTAKGIKDAVLGASSLVGTSFKRNPDKFAERVLALGLIEPVVTGGIKRRERMVQREGKDPSWAGRKWQSAKEFATLLREAKEGIEIYPGLAVFLDEMNFHLSRRGDLAERYAKAEAIEPSKRTRQDRLVIKEMETLQEDVANRVKHTIFAFSRAPRFAKITEKYGLSSFATYYADTFRVIGNSFRYGYAEMMEGKRQGDTDLTVRGARKMLGATMSTLATPAVVTAGLAADIKVIGAFTLMAAAGALGEGTDEDDIIEQLAILQEAMPFSDQSKSTVFTRVDDDMTVHYTDAGRWESLDPSTSTLRSVIAGTAKAISDGDTQMLEDIGGTSLSQFFGGSMLVDTIKLGYRAATEKGDVKVKPSVEAKAPRFMEGLYSYVNKYTPVSAEYARRGAAVIEKAVPVVGRNIPVAIERLNDPDKTALDALQGLIGDFSTSWNVKDDIQDRAGAVYVGTIRGARKEGLGDILRRRTEVTEDELYDAYSRVAEQEREALSDFKVKLDAYRVVNRQLNRRQDLGLSEVLDKANVKGGLRDMALGTKPFVPQEIKEDMLEDAITREADRVRGASDRSKDLPNQAKQRITQLQRIRERWIRENLNQ